MLRLSKLSVCGLLLLFFCLIVRSFRFCTRIKTAQQPSFIACVGQQYLYASDLDSLDVLATGSVDSSSAINHYAEEWACKKLLVANGNKASQAVQSSIEGQFSAYKDDLLAYHFLEKSVARIFHDRVTPDEISGYYKKYKDNQFILHHDIVKGVFLAIPKGTSGINSVKSLMLSTKPADRKKLKSYCNAYARAALLDSDRWVSWEDVLAKVGFRPPGAPTRLLKTNKFIDLVCRKNRYLLKIDQYKIAQEVAPLELVEERIKAIILHKRRLDLGSKIKSKLLQDAKKNHSCVIHGS